jgi:hypothetical protein
MSTWRISSLAVGTLSLDGVGCSLYFGLFRVADSHGNAGDSGEV